MRTSLPVAALLLVACATIPTQTKFMEKEGAKVSSEALRMRLRSEAIPFTGLMEQAADASSAEATTPAQRRRALIWKINVVPALYRTLFNQRPLIAVLDTWALLVQAEDYLESPAGREAFGPGAAVVLATTKDLQLRVKGIAAWALPEKDLAQVDAKVRGWAAKHPVKLTFATRDSIEQAVVSLAPGEELSAFALVGLMSEDLEGLISRMDFLPIMVPRQATWQGELAYLDLMEPRVEVALTRAGEALQRVDDMIAWLGTTGLEGFAEEQRIQIMKAFAAERVEIGKLIDRERTGVEVFVARERSEIAALVQRERAAAMADAQRLADHATLQAAQQGRDLVDHAIARLALLVGATLLGVLGIVLVARRKRPAPPPQA
ncbi:MAG: hypothetical protein WCS72_04175 [Deltaproteobacteria bacterium]